MTTALIVIAAILVALVLGFVGIYNGLIKKRNLVHEAWAQIDTELKRRHDLIGNLVETVKGYAAHERGTLEDVIKARAGAMAPGQSPAQQAESENMLSQALGRLLAIAEAYPDLKANQNMMQLTEELTSTENKVAFARQAFNDAVMGYNNKREVFPNSIFAGMFNFAAATLLEIPQDKQAQVREAPKVQF